MEVQGEHIYVRTCLHTAVCNINCRGNRKANRIIQGYATQSSTNIQFKYLHRKHKKETQINVNTCTMELSVHTKICSTAYKMLECHKPNSMMASAWQNRHFSRTVLYTRVAGLDQSFLIFFLQTIQCNLINRQFAILTQLKLYIRF